MRMRRTNPASSGWGLEILWAQGPTRFRFVARGIVYPRSLACFDLEAWRPGGDPSLRFFSNHGRVLTFLRTPLSPSEPVGPIDLLPFWTLCRRARAEKTPEVVIDWLHDYGPEQIVRLLDFGLPELGEVPTFDVPEDRGDPQTDALADHRVGTV